MRVLYFSTDYGPHDHRFLAALSRTDHTVYYVRLQPNRRAVEDRTVPEKVVQLHWAGDDSAFSWRQVPRRIQALKRLIREVRPNLIHAGPIQTCAFLAVASGFRPVLTMSWGFDLMQDADRNAWWRWVTRHTLSRSTFFVSDAEVTRAKAVEFGMRADRTEVFPWGVDLAHFRPASSEASGNETRRARFVVLCNRSWEPRYGVDVLARAFIRFADQNAMASIVLLGGGSQAGLIRQILHDGGHLERVTFGGQVPQARLPQLYQQADLFVSPSHVDGSSVSLMEALACGTPVLVSDIPANREWVRDGENGWLFKDGDAEDLARKMLQICADAAGRAAVRREARKTAEQRADWEENAKVLLHVYQKALELS